MQITNPFNLPLWPVQKPLGLGGWLWTLNKRNHPRLQPQPLCRVRCLPQTKSAQPRCLACGCGFTNAVFFKPVSKDRQQQFALTCQGQRCTLSVTPGTCQFCSRPDTVCRDLDHAWAALLMTVCWLGLIGRKWQVL